MQNHAPPRFPPWLRKRLPREDGSVAATLRETGADTVCRGAHCPNRAECHAAGQAAFLLMGPHCTRECAFCAMGRGAGNPPAPLDSGEPGRVAAAAFRLGLEHVVVTSVTRDDLPDGGASHFAAAAAAIRQKRPTARLELLVPDFGGNRDAWRTAAGIGAEVFNHNLETVPRLYAAARPGASYARSLDLLAFAAGRPADGQNESRRVKSGLMAGLGETMDEILAAASDLRQAGVDMITVGQYLCPSRGRLLPVARFVPPDEFARLEKSLWEMGFLAVDCHPWARSSYAAPESFRAMGPPESGGEKP